MKFINWLKAVWLSFKVAQNTQRLIFLLSHLDGQEDNQKHAVTVATYRNVVRRFLCNHPHLDSNIWPLEEARDLKWRSDTLIAIGESLLYGTD